MKATAPTYTFTLNLTHGQRKDVEAARHEALKANEIEDEAIFVKNVASVRWKQKSTLCTYFPETGETQTQIADADVNPFGWRLDHR